MAEVKCVGCGWVNLSWGNESWWAVKMALFSNRGKTRFRCACSNCGEMQWVYPPAPSYIPTTQKARGIFALLKHGLNLGLSALPVNYIQSVKNPLPEVIPGVNFPQFARPCPPNPEHGFVDSRIVGGLPELEVVRTETLAANPDSEILLMNPVDACWNAVWTPSLLVLGRGHDGATAGKEAISIPLAGMNPIGGDLMKAAGIALDKAPYIEAVTYKSDMAHYTSLCQLRGGPVLESGVNLDFVPEETLVEEVIQTSGEDLLAWASKVRSLKGVPGKVVYHPGGALTDHYSVHCRENGVPIYLTRKPILGEILLPLPMPPLDPLALLEGLAVGDAMKVNFRNAGSFIRLALVSLHNSSVMRGPHSFWIGVSVAALLKLGCGALEAEARHAHSCYKGMTSKPNIYDYYASKSLSFLRSRLSRVSQLLHYGFGPVTGSHGYGGPKWALCGAGMCPLFNGIKRLTENPTEENASSILLALNISINQAHNGGWWLNKFIGIEAYDRAPQGNLDIVLQLTQAVESAMEARKDSSTHLARFKSRVSLWPETTSIAPLKWRKVSLEVGAGALVLNLKAATLPKPQQIAIPITPTVVNALIKAAGRIDIQKGRIDIITQSGETINVFMEDPLAMEARDVKRSH